MNPQLTIWSELDKSNGSVLAKDDLKIPPIRDLTEIQDDKSVLERISGVDWSFTKDNTTYLSHNLHPYPAKFIPQIPCNFISALSMPGETVWDPFGGSGTTAFEALSQGRTAISTDANSIATLVASAKCCTLTPEQITTLNRLSEKFSVLANNPANATALLVELKDQVQARYPDIPNFDKWFHPFAKEELAYISIAIDQLDDEDSKQFAKTSLSAIIIKSSFQDSETRYASKPRDMERGEIFSYFAQHLSRAIEKHKPIHSLLGYRKPIIKTLDLRSFDPNDTPAEFAAYLPKESVDLIVTSPPYANANDYHLYHRFRLFWLNYTPKALADCEIGSHLRHQRKKQGFDLYLEEMTTCLRAMHHCLRPGRFAVIVVGDSIFDGETICTAEKLSENAGEIGFTTTGIIERSIHKTKRSFIAAARRAKAERILIIRKPIKNFQIFINPPNYNQWDYEKILQHKEVEALLGRSVPNKRKKIEAQATPLEFGRLRRLTFSHFIEIPESSSFHTWQAILENGDSIQNAKTRKDPKYVTHGIHPYKGKFYPQLAKTLINLSSETNGTVLDPYCGSGTVLLESQLNGMNAVGFDLNPLAALIAKAKTGIISEDLYAIDLCIHDFLDDLGEDQSTENDQDIFPENCIDEIRSWFPMPVANCLGWILNRIERVPILSLQQALKVSLSSIIRKVSQQDPKDLRIRRRKEPIEDAPTLELFKARVSELRRRLREFAMRKVHCPNSIGLAKVVEGDSRDWTNFTNENIGIHSLDIMVTSPPYATALPYIDTDRLSILTILGIPSKVRAPLERSLTGSREIQTKERREIEESIETATIDTIGAEAALNVTKRIYRLNSKSKVGFRRKNMGALLLRYFRDLYATLTSVDNAVKDGGSMFVVIGNNHTKAGDKDTKVIIKNTDYTVEMGERLGWRLVEEIPITVTKEGYKHEKHFINKNSILWFSK